MVMSDLDEYGTPDAQKITAGQNVGFPLRKTGVTLQWTRSWQLTHTPAELAAQVDAAIDADRLAAIRDIKRALFGVANYDFIDREVDFATLPVKRLVNADSASINLGPNGETFDGATHTHYLARVGALAATDISALITAVAEHYSVGETRIYINRASEAAVRGFTSNFVPFVDARIRPAIDVTTAVSNLEMNNVYDREIGLFDSAVVEVKPWVPANYMLAIQTGVDPALARRIDPRVGDGLQLQFEDERHPLRARGWERRQGFGVRNRTAAAVLYTGGTSYVVPTIS
jgi:hypothetical protein